MLFQPNIDVDTTSYAHWEDGKNSLFKIELNKSFKNQSNYNNVSDVVFITFLMTFFLSVNLKFHHSWQ